MESGWDLKHMHRLITLMQPIASPLNPPEWMEKDPRNSLSLVNRMRLESEIVRDVALHAAGLLETTVGGPSVRPHNQRRDDPRPSAANGVPNKGPIVTERHIPFCIERRPPSAFGL